MTDESATGANPVAETGAPDAWMVEEFDDGEWDPIHLAFDEEGAVEFCAEVRESAEAADETVTFRITHLYRRAPSGEPEGGV